MKSLLYALSLVLILSSLSLQAQTPNYKNGLSYSWMAIDHYGPFQDDFSFGDDFITSGGMISYHRSLNSNFLNLEVPLRIGAVNFFNADGSNRNDGFLGLDALLQLHYTKPDASNWLVPYLSAGFGAMVFDKQDGLDGEVPLGLGLDVKLDKQIYLKLRSEYRFGFEEDRNNWNHIIGLKIVFGDGPKEEPIEVVPTDTDGDGISDNEDKCPTVPGIAAFQGCPDTDGDGITDADDACPEVAGLSKFNGCPDTDNDGVTDAEDNCPDVAGPVSNNGCPLSDKDGDGVVDAEDNCPDVPGTVANSGCPEKSLMVTAKDKLTNELLPNVEVSLVNSSGQTIATGVTNGQGVIELKNVTPGNYTINAILYDVKLESAQVQASDFNASDAVQKTVFYDDPNFIVEGKVFFCNSPNPLGGVTLNLKNNADNFMKTTISDANGKFIFHLSQRANYDMYATKESFLSQVVNVNTNDYNRSKSVFVRLEVCAEEVKCGEAVRLNNILYDSGKSFIREDAKPDLNKVVQFMRDNKDAKIELSAHTDSTGGSSANQRLSERRAKAAADYIIGSGISASRVISKGYGESRLLNNCRDGVKCSSAEHQLNRRTEFKVICPK